MDYRKNKKFEELISAGFEFRNTQIFEARKAENGDKIIRGYATTFNDPYLLYDWGDYKVYEQIDRHAFDECDMSDVIMQYDHEGRVFARTSNNTVELSTDDHGLAVEGNLSGTTLGGEVYEEVSGGYSTKMSMRFRVAEDKREVTEDHENNITTVMRTITKISKLYDVSVVSIPANDGTEISARCFADGVIAELKAERLRAEERAKKIKILNLLLEVSS